MLMNPDLNAKLNLKHQTPSGRTDAQMSTCIIGTCIICRLRDEVAFKLFPTRPEDHFDPTKCCCTKRQQQTINEYIVCAEAPRRDVPRGGAQAQR